ncbi:hypothetical protein [Kribbella sp. NBC_00359]|uniref:hypothetical protein n=1 Tax=Kribbella sp. NBC_00359 TaxID=2975966 RepID=UPI002E24CB93
MAATPDAVGLEVGEGLVDGGSDGLLGGAAVGAEDERVGVGVGDAPPVGAISLHPTSPAAATSNPATSLTLRR